MKRKPANGHWRRQLNGGQGFAKKRQGRWLRALEQANENVIQHANLGLPQAVDIGQEQAGHLLQDAVAALIEWRPYRPSMSRPDAYKILCDMDGKLEKALVKAFASVALKG